MRLTGRLRRLSVRWRLAAPSPRAPAQSVIPDDLWTNLGPVLTLESAIRSTADLSAPLVPQIRERLRTGEGWSSHADTGSGAASTRPVRALP